MEERSQEDMLYTKWTKVKMWKKWVFIPIALGKREVKISITSQLKEASCEKKWDNLQMHHRVKERKNVKKIYYLPGA